MKFRLCVLLFLAAFSFYLLGCGGGGGGGGAASNPVATTANNSLSGTISFPAGSSASVTARISLDASLSGMKVRLVDVSENDLVSSVDIDGAGFFTFPNVPSGSNYRLLVISKANKKLLQKHLDSFSTSQTAMRIDAETTTYAILVKQSNFAKSEAQIIDAVNQGKISVKTVSDKINEWLKGASNSTETDVEKAIVGTVGVSEIQKIIDGIPSSLTATPTPTTPVTPTTTPTPTPTQQSNPTISAINPGLAKVGSSITIYGLGFGSSQSMGSGGVTFGGQSATITYWSDGYIQTTVPTGVSGVTTNILVTVNGNQSNAVALTMIPTIKSITSRVTQNETVTISGNNFGDSIGSISMTGTTGVISPTSWSDTQVQFKYLWGGGWSSGTDHSETVMVVTANGQQVATVISVY